MLYIFGKLGASSKQWFILYFISDNEREERLKNNVPSLANGKSVFISTR